VQGVTGQQEFVDAVRSFWDVRGSQALTGRGEGSGAAVRGGRHFDALTQLVAQPFLEAGFHPSQLHTGRRATIPGFYRPAKDWDLVVTDGSALVAAFEFKALGGPSFGNNFNNRAEEALGNAADLWRAYANGSLGSLRPWLGYFFLIEDGAGSRRRSSRITTPTVGELDLAFRNSSYQERAATMCERLLAERLYDAVCFAATSRDPSEVPIEPHPQMTWSAFLAAISARITFVGRQGASGP
jgi:hypothetical protein